MEVNGNTGYGGRGMKQGLGRIIRGAEVVSLAAVGLVLAGCGNFFVYPGSGSGGSTSGGTTGSYAYVSNNASSSTALSIYALAGGTLGSSSTFSLGFSPAALAIPPSNKYLYASNPSTAAIYAYTVGSTGLLTNDNSGNAVAVSVDAVSMDVSADGQWLFALDGIQQAVLEYKIDSSTGLLSLISSSTYALPQGSIPTPASIKVAPSGSFIVAALGTAGDVIFPFVTSTGVINPNYVLLPTNSALVGDFSVALDANNFLYVARTTGLAVYSLSSLGTPTLVAGSPFATGSAPRSVLLSLSGNYLYVANQTDGTISGFSIGTTGALSALPLSPFQAPTTVTALGRDNSGKYVLAAGYNGTAGLTLYTIGSTGALTASGGSVATGTSTAVPVVMGLTH
jgi:6-phosphogluconolactonase